LDDYDALPNYEASSMNNARRAELLVVFHRYRLSKVSSPPSGCETAGREVAPIANVGALLEWPEVVDL
jgi:hypothetical protein